MPRNILARSDLQPAAAAFAEACGYSRSHSAMAAIALRDYGDHGPQISACVRDHFPEGVKDELRRLAYAVRDFSDKAWQLRPRGVRASTMRALSRAVAARDGSGFYGPQP